MPLRCKGCKGDRMNELEQIKDEPKTLNIKGKERELKFNFSAWAEIEKKYDGINNLERLQKDVEERPFETLPSLIYIGLTDKSGVTEKNCLDDFSMGDIEKVVSVLFSALFGSLPEDKKKAVAKKVKK